MKTDNELIAEFMGYYFQQDRFTRPDGQYTHKEDGHGLFVEEMKYDTSWDWLMPVVIKCHEVGDAKEREFPEAKNLDDPTGWKAWNYRRVGLSTNIEQVYKNVILFIKWYNSQEK